MTAPYKLLHKQTHKKYPQIAAEYKFAFLFLDFFSVILAQLIAVEVNTIWLYTKVFFCYIPRLIYRGHLLSSDWH